MAEIATLIGGVTYTKTGKKAHSAAVEAGEVVVINGQVVVAINTAAIDIDNAFAYEGSIMVKKTAALAINFGDVVYWDDTAKEMNKTNTNTKAGVCIEDAAASDTDVVLYLMPNA